MTNRIGRVAVVALWLAAMPALAQTDVQPVRYNEVELQADASREVQNDLMYATMFVEANDPNPASLAVTLNNSTNAALKTAAEAKAVRARSGSTQTYPVYDRANKVSGWRGRAEVRLESRDFQALGGLIGRLQATMQLAGVTFVVSPEARRQAENELVTEAIGAFRTRADIARQALGGRGIKIRRVAIGTAGAAPPPRPVIAMRAQPMGAAAESAPSFEGGTSQIQVTVAGTVEVD